MMRASWRARLSSVVLAVLCVGASATVTAGCGASGRDARDVAADLEGPVGETMVERLLRDVDLTRATLELSAGHSVFERFEGSDQQRLEAFLRETADQLAGDSLRVTQQVIEDTGRDTQRLTLTLEVHYSGGTRFVPVEIDLQRDARKVFVTRARVMAEVR